MGAASSRFAVAAPGPDAGHARHGGEHSDWFPDKVESKVRRLCLSDLISQNAFITEFLKVNSHKKTISFFVFFYKFIKLTVLWYGRLLKANE